MRNPSTTSGSSTHCLPRHKFTFWLYRLAGKIYARAYLGFRSKAEERSIQEPHLILCNSQTLQDALLVRLAFDYPVYCVQTQAQRRTPIALVTDALTAPIWQKPGKSTWSADAMQNIKQVTREGGSVCLFPCGDPVYGYAPRSISKQTVPLIRALNVPVILYTLHGGAGALPRWSDGRRQGPFIGRLERTLMPDEYAEMSDIELFALINRTLSVNDKSLALTYHSNHRAERLERVLYVCPRCREHSVIYSSGTHVSCRGCGMTANYTEAGNFVFLNCETPISTVDTWMDYQVSWLKNHMESFTGEIYTDDGITVLSVGKKPADEPLFGKLIMTRDKLLIKFEDGERGMRTVGFALDSTDTLTPCDKNKLALTNAQGTWEISGAGGFCAYKYAQLFNALRGRFGK